MPPLRLNPKLCSNMSTKSSENKFVSRKNRTPPRWSSLSCLLLLSVSFACLNTVTQAVTTAEKQLIQQQLRGLSPAQLLKEYAQTPMAMNASRAVYDETSVEALIARTHAEAKKLQRQQQQQRTLHHRQHQQQQQQQRAHKRKKHQQQQQQRRRQEDLQPHKSRKHEKSHKQREREHQQQQQHGMQSSHHAAHRKTKSGLPIESNINSNEFVADNIALADATNAATKAAAATSAFAVNTNKRATTTAMEQQQQQKKKNGRNGASGGGGSGGGGSGRSGHGIRDVGRQKLHRNGKLPFFSNKAQIFLWVYKYF
ncbi:unnamed protein product [Ceratitis capitata]|uniref:(Mediterranean fruit fly) hypothetical protein n=1 Tax=Ceratitis capitata TaxID=7213 RepID=A0A811UJ37_CERCA|nr:unnamed protein product [Ceratitis capitata]